MLPHSQHFDDSGREVLPEQTSGDEGELRLLRILRASRERNDDLFTDRELARLRFLRWLVETGRMSR